MVDCELATGEFLISSIADAYMLGQAALKVGWRGFAGSAAFSVVRRNLSGIFKEALSVSTLSWVLTGAQATVSKLKESSRTKQLSWMLRPLVKRDFFSKASFRGPETAMFLDVIHESFPRSQARKECRLSAAFLENIVTRNDTTAVMS